MSLLTALIGTSLGFHKYGLLGAAGGFVGGAVAGGLTKRLIGRSVRLGTMAMGKTIAQGTISTAAGLPAAVGGMAYRTARSAELGARVLLTGGPGRDNSGRFRLWNVASNPIDAWFPHLRNTDMRVPEDSIFHKGKRYGVEDYFNRNINGRGESMEAGLKRIQGETEAYEKYRADSSIVGILKRSVTKGEKVGVAGKPAEMFFKKGFYEQDLKKFRPNGRIATAFAVGSAVAAIGAMGAEAVFGNHAPAPTVYYDGTSMRHINDMGANGNYAAKVLGPNSQLTSNSIDRGTMIRAIDAFI